MQTPAVTIIFKADGTAQQTAGLETLLDAQVEALALAGRLNNSGVPGAVRGEVWSQGRVVASTYFDPALSAEQVAAAAAEAAEAEAAKAAAEAEAAKAAAEAEAAKAAAEAPAEPAAEPAAEPVATPAPVSGRKR